MLVVLARRYAFLASDTECLAGKMIYRAPACVMLAYGTWLPHVSISASYAKLQAVGGVQASEPAL